ncbi:MAG: glycine cleavage system aminomethyltransferase GcvT [Bacilli bacterium]|jgi:aminomethyltransferase|nr:glycine cleavage system aminomethyltransferase GcvT [Bacilli bacterium]
MKRTALFENHLQLGAKMVEYAGYEMPVEYAGLTVEHLATRQNCGIFDVSHMGEILVTGKQARDFVNYAMTGKLRPDNMKMNYGLFLYGNGTVVDDLMAYYYSPYKILLVVNASNLDKDYAWLTEQNKEWKMDVEITNISEDLSQIALQGPNAAKLLYQETDYDINRMQLFDFDEMMLGQDMFIVSRSGYTGEDGFEIYGKGQAIQKLFTKFIQNGAVPCGLGARDTLRFEANLPLYGHEIADTITPLEATLTFAIDFSKDFMGKAALLKQKEEGLKRKIVALELQDRGIARADYEVEKDGQKIGSVTTGYFVPGQEKPLALAMLDAPYWDLGTEVDIRIRKNLVRAVIRNKKFLNKKYVK